MPVVVARTSRSARSAHAALPPCLLRCVSLPSRETRLVRSVATVTSPATPAVIPVPRPLVPTCLLWRSQSAVWRSALLSSCQTVAVRR
ncbi:hypothetical protein BDM02DRAFT_3110357 [Thelephora ganbajun]|uniref:Uncharacterized protein n=1 Tax=Thelephora ganbajun TaxID=370292 RepID=A0ACB6ZQ13_THEGA|nr:hypothetical protein BDM02DRAFT_3110357 [Thelephora ganbajun]